MQLWACILELLYKVSGLTMRPNKFTGISLIIVGSDVLVEILRLINAKFAVE